jgi:hypothetical protein
VTAPEIEDDDENADDRRGEESILANEEVTRIEAKPSIRRVGIATHRRASPYRADTGFSLSLSDRPRRRPRSRSLIIVAKGFSVIGEALQL